MALSFNLLLLFCNLIACFFLCVQDVDSRSSVVQRRSSATVLSGHEEAKELPPR